MSRLHEHVVAARAGIENLNPAELAAEVAGGSVLVIDVREPTEAAAGTVPGAVVVPRGLLEFWIDQRPGDRERVVLCSTTGARSALAARTLQALGHSGVAHLAGGLQAWTADGRPLRPAAGAPSDSSGPETLRRRRSGR